MSGERFDWFQQPRWGRWNLALWLALAVAALLAVIIWVPRLLYPPYSAARLAQVRDPAQRIELVTARGSLQNQARSVLLEGVAGVAVIAAALAGYGQLQAIRRSQGTERFMRAIEQLGNQQGQVDVVLGGIYALGGIARTTPGEQGVVADVLAAYARGHAPWPPSQPGQFVASADLDKVPELPARAPDIQAVLTVLGQDGSGGTDRPLDLHGCDLRKASLRGGWLEGADLHGAHLERADLSDAHLRRANLRDAELAQADLTGADLEEADLVGADLTGSKLNGAQLGRASLIGTRLRGANLRGAQLEGASLHRARLDAASLTAAQLKGAILTSARLKQAFLTSAHLEGAVLTRAHLEGVGAAAAHLEGCGLSAARLQGGNLTGAHLEGADLSDAQLEGATLKDAHLERANLSGANLEGADLSGARLDQVVLDERTVWPGGSGPPAALRPGGPGPVVAELPAPGPVPELTPETEPEGGEPGSLRL